MMFLAFSCSINLIVYAKNSLTPRSIKVVMDDNYPPYVFRDEKGVLQGILIDQWKLWEKYTGIKVSIDAMPWNQALTEMKMGNYDVIDTMFENEERANLYDFTVGYEEIQVPIFFNKDISGVTGPESLKGFSVAVKRGDACIKILQENGIADIVEYDNYEDIVKAAGEHKINIFVIDKPPALYYLYKYKIEDQFNYYGSLYTGQFHRAVKKGHNELLDEINLGFSLISEKEYRDINDKWYGYINTNYGIIKKVIVLATASGIILLMLILWNSTLHKKVKEKTKELSLLVEELRKSEARGKALLQAIPDMFLLINKDGKILDYKNAKNNDLFRIPSKFINENLSAIFKEEISEKFFTVIKKVIETGNIETIEYSISIQNANYEFEARLVLCDFDKVVVIVRDITEKKVAEACLYELSTRDILTGLFNRNYFEEKLIRFQEEALSNIGIIILDLNDLKLINDTLGHAVGDKYLNKAAQFLTLSFTGEGFIARIGGDEFVVFLWNTSEDEIKKYCEIFNNKLEEHNSTNNSIPLIVSLGYAFSKGNEYDLQEMFKTADDKMYREKFYYKQNNKGQTLGNLKEILEEKNIITKEHAEFLTKTAVNFARAAQINEKQIEDIRLLIQFQNIGKIALRDELRFKIESLTEDEVKEIQHHVQSGYRIAQASKEIAHIQDLILRHHENWDGSGYPFGLRENEIPIQCRIAAVINAYDYIINTSGRGIEKNIVIEDIKKLAGTILDPYLVDKFIKNIQL